MSVCVTKKGPIDLIQSVSHPRLCTIRIEEDATVMRLFSIRLSNNNQPSVRLIVEANTKRGTGEVNGGATI